METVHQIEMQAIQWLHTFRSDGIDNFFRMLNFFDTFWFPFLLVPIIWFGWRSDLGKRIAYLLIGSAVVNHLLKQFFAQPRPSQIDPSLALLPFGTSYGFPSGGAQSALLYAGLIVMLFKSPWKWFVAANVLFWISLSRIFLGAHFFTDVLGGWAVGLCLLGMFRLLEKRPVSPVWIIAIALGLLFFAESRRIVMPLFLLLGMSMGELLRVELPDPKGSWDRIMRPIITLAGGMVILTLLPNPIFLGLWMTFGCPLLFGWKFNLETT